MNYDISCHKKALNDRPMEQFQYYYEAGEFSLLTGFCELVYMVLGIQIKACISQWYGG